MIARLPDLPVDQRSVCWTLGSAGEQRRRMIRLEQNIIDLTLKATGDVGRLVEDLNNDRGRCQRVADPVRPDMDPKSSRFPKLRVWTRGRQSSLGRYQDGIACSFDGDEKIAGRIESVQPLVMLNQRVNLGFGAPAEGNQARRTVGVAFWRRASIRTMLARSRSRTGSSGTVSPSAICRSLSASEVSRSTRVRRVGSFIVGRIAFLTAAGQVGSAF